MEQSLRLYLERALAQLELLEPFGTPSGHQEQSLRLYLERALAQLELLEPSETS